MKLLLDTHAAAWWWLGSPLLGKQREDLVREQADEVFVSSVTAWEIARKVAIGKFREAQLLASSFAAFVEDDGFIHLPLSHDHAVRAAAYPQEHRDPFDRMLAAQAELEGLTLLTKDTELSAFPCAALW